ncbi:MAG: LysM peptidoglycan-binding domain-containing protein [Paenibacillaceae bacterium]
MSTADNNPVYFIEEDQKIAKTSYYISKNQALLNKATQLNWKHKKAIRFLIIAILLVLAITCGALIHAFASSHEQLTVGITSVALMETIAHELNAVDVVKGDTLWSIANQYAPSNESISSYVHKIMKLNGLTKPTIQEGHLLMLP